MSKNIQNRVKEVLSGIVRHEDDSRPDLQLNPQSRRGGCSDCCPKCMGSGVLVAGELPIASNGERMEEYNRQANLLLAKRSSIREMGDELKSPRKPRKPKSSLNFKRNLPMQKKAGVIDPPPLCSRRLIFPPPSQNPPQYILPPSRPLQYRPAPQPFQNIDHHFHYPEYKQERTEAKEQAKKKKGSGKKKMPKKALDGLYKYKTRMVELKKQYPQKTHKQLLSIYRNEKPKGGMRRVGLARPSNISIQPRIRPEMQEEKDEMLAEQRVLDWERDWVALQNRRIRMEEMAEKKEKIKPLSHKKKF